MIDITHRELCNKVVDMIRDKKELIECIKGLLMTSYPDSFAAAINLILFNHYGLHVIMIQRSINPRDPWSGDIAFPGGRTKPSETPIDTIVRETWEEIGLANKQYEILGFLEPVSPKSIPSMIVVPVVSILTRGDIRSLKPRSREVERIIFVQLPILIRKLYVRHPYRGTMVEAFKDWYGNIIWGMSLRVLENLVKKIKMCESHLSKG